MGIQESTVQLCTEEQYRKQRQGKINYRQQRQKRKQFYKIQQCQYPHPVIYQNHPHNHHHQKSFDQNHSHRCTMKHAGYPDTYHLCSQCEKYPQKIRRNPPINYAPKGYELIKPQSPNYDYQPTTYQQRDVLAPGPQVPSFYNAFSLPIDRYYKQKINFMEYHTEPQNQGSPFRIQSHSFEESVYEQASDKRQSIQNPIHIDFEGAMQNLKKRRNY